MVIHLPPPRHTGFRLPLWRRAEPLRTDEEQQPRTVTGALALSAFAARVLIALVFLWAFLDKAFGWGYSTPSDRAWINGGSPTQGFLGGVAAGPMESTFHSWAGATWTDWLFMLGLLGVGVALASGIALRLAAGAGTVMMALMWAAEWPPARYLSDGALSMSSNPIIDSHVMYAVILTALAVTAAYPTWGLGRVWQELPFVRRNRWLI